MVLCSMRRFTGTQPAFWSEELRHVQRTRPQLISKIGILNWTPPSPCLPFVVSQQTSEVTVAAVRRALESVCADPVLAPVRKILLLEGVDLTPDTTFRRVSELELRAEQWRYSSLA